MQDIALQALVCAKSCRDRYNWEKLFEQSITYQNCISPASTCTAQLLGIKCPLGNDDHPEKCGRVIASEWIKILEDTSICVFLSSL